MQREESEWLYYTEPNIRLILKRTCRDQLTALFGSLCHACVSMRFHSLKKDKINLMIQMTESGQTTKYTRVLLHKMIRLYIAVSSSSVKRG